MLYNTNLPNALHLCAHTNQNTKSQGTFGQLGQSAAQSLNLQNKNECSSLENRNKERQIPFIPYVTGAWTERKKIFHGGSFLKLADDNMDIQNPEAQNRELSGF